jgi:hypothetical protein
LTTLGSGLNFDEFLATCIRVSLANKTFVSVVALDISEESHVIHFRYGKAPLVAIVVVRLLRMPIDIEVDFLSRSFPVPMLFQLRHVQRWIVEESHTADVTPGWIKSL